MPKIYNNIENILTTGLGETLKLTKRTDCCVGYFNLRGWNELADTAGYLTEQLKRRGVTKIENVTGNDENPTIKAKRFSPKSNQMEKMETEQELRVLISTDVLSEGQNLPSSATCTNFIQLGMKQHHNWLQILFVRFVRKLNNSIKIHREQTTQLSIPKQ